MNLNAPPLTLPELRRLMETVEPVPEIRACVCKWLPDGQSYQCREAIRTLTPPHRMVTLLFVHPSSESRIRALDAETGIRWVDPRDMLNDLEGFELSLEDVPPPDMAHDCAE